MAHRIVSFEEALKETEYLKRHLLLGNGFSIALFPNRFRYGSLLEQANFADIPKARAAFERLNTTDFEVVVEALNNAARLLPLYSTDETIRQRMLEHAEVLKEILVRAIAGRHPDRPADISEQQYKSCRAFLANFVGESRIREIGGKEKDVRGSIYSLNYDLLLYWTLLHDQVVNWNAADPLASVVEETENLQHDDGFRAPEDDPDAAYVTWDGEGTAPDGQNIHFLHGALHLFDYGAELQKRCWERSGGIPLIDQIRLALNEGRFPLFVSEGSSEGKFKRIRHNGYLQRSLRSFAQTCRNKNSLFVFGHSLAANDDHVIRRVEKGKIPSLYVSLHGDPATEENGTIIAKAEGMAAARHEKWPLEVAFFRAEDANVWGVGNGA